MTSSDDAQPPGAVRLSWPEGEGLEPAFTAALVAAACAGRSVEWTDVPPGPFVARVAFARAVAEACDGALMVGRGRWRFTPRALRASHLTLELPASEPVARAWLALWPLLSLARGTSDVVLSGATHPPSGLSFHDVAIAHRRAFEAAGLGGEFVLETASVAPGSPGRVRGRAFPAPRLRHVELIHRGLLDEVRAIALVPPGSSAVAMSVVGRVVERLRAAGIPAEPELLPVPAERGRHIAIVVVAQFEHAMTSFTTAGEVLSVGGDGAMPARLVDDSVAGLRRFLSSRGAIDADLAPLLLVPASLAASPLGAPGAIGQPQPRSSRFSTTRVSVSLLETAHVVRSLLDVDVLVQGLPDSDGVVELRPRSSGT